MKLTLESRGKHLIRGYSEGEVRINDRTINHNCVISENQLVEWQVSQQFTNEDIAPILALNPELVILGLKDVENLPPASTYAAFLERGIGFEVMDMGAACRTFNILISEDRRVVAALVLKSLQ
ncbi:MAG TPA: MTH938/NDUFAF3 family protein [Steroidobacteraceae bacterium]|nr:MTH938/NDUFAF3 family protein [Steroidobacteraceae bacterium]